MNDRYLFKAKGNPEYNAGEWYVGYLAKDSDGDFFMRDLAEKLGTTDTKICRIEKGSVKLSLEDAVRIADLFMVPLGRLIGRKE